jgi:hypothetical protein
MSSKTTASRTPAEALAAEAYDLVQASPRRALALAERALEAARAERNPRAEVAALYALSWAQHELGDPGTVASAKAGIRIGERHGDRRGVALLRRRLAIAYAFAGDARTARREIDAAVAMLGGRDRARSEVFRVEIHRRERTADSDRNRLVCADAARALSVLRRAGDSIWEARLLFNRGLLFTDLGRLDAAAADLRRAHELYESLDAEVAAVDAAAALGEVERLRGDLRASLAILEELRSTLPSSHPGYNLEGFRAAALAQARLLPEARAATEAYIELLERTGRGDEAASVGLDLAAILIASQDPHTARRLAERARRSFAARGQPHGAAVARTVVLSAGVLEGTTGRASIRSGLGAAGVLERAGFRREALRARLLVARLALASGSARIARRELGRGRALKVRGTVADRVELCHVRALIDLASGFPLRAERSLELGLRLLDEHRASFGAAELRATASGGGAELSALGLELALRSREPERVLVWSERLRASSLRLPPARPPADRRLRDLQAELRLIHLRARAALSTGEPERGTASAQRRLESAIQARLRILAGTGAEPARQPGFDRAAAALGPRVLVEYVELGGRLAAITLADGELCLHELGPDTTAEELDWLRFALERLARGERDRSRRVAATENAEQAASALDRALVEPLLSSLGVAPLVVVPTNALHAVPWGALPSLRGRSVLVTPSLAVWQDLAARRPARSRASALIAGPRLRHSASEVLALAALYPDATVLHGRSATAAAALAALDGAALAHVACHGHFRSDSPLFSSLELGDGPLNVFELQRLRRAPEIVVLSACNLALSRLHPGDELLGLAAALLGMGTRTIVASVVPVRDTTARRLMLAFHRHLAAGLEPAAALARAQSGKPGSAGFICLGNG